ncbi:MAG: hypothetical protein R2880_04975 [Deinococcales bacterium]
MEELLSSSQPLSIDNAEAAKILMNPRSLRLLEPFIAQEKTISQAATELKVKPNSLLVKVKRFMALGLVKIVREEKRSGRAIKIYRAVADSFFIPFDTTSAESLEASLAERDGYWQELLRKNVVQARMEHVGSYGTRIYRDTQQRLQVQAALTPYENYAPLGPNDPAVLSAWRDNLYLDFHDAKELQQEMFKLMLKYLKKQGAQRYIIRLGLAPLIDWSA